MSVIPPFTSFLKALAEQPPLLISSFAAAAMMLVNGWTDAPVAIAPAATELIIRNPQLFNDYEITKGKMDDVFLAVTGKTLVGGAEK